jgi:Fic family protein
MKGAEMIWNPEKPHNELPSLPPSHTLESRYVLKACINARVALAELKQAASLIPNQTMLINTIPLLEAKDSSEIENIVTTTDKLFQHAQWQSHADSATKEALRYRSALNKGFQSLKERPLCTATAVEICQTLKGVAKRQAASRYLKSLVDIKVLNEMSVGKEKLFIHPKLMRLLSQDANRFEPYIV